MIILRIDIIAMKLYLLLKEEDRGNYSNWVLNFDNLANGLLDVRVICCEGEGEI